MLRKLTWVLALLALCSVPIVYSLGLGEINLHSGLNQPLSADIEIHSLRAREADSIKVLLGSDNDFAGAGLQRPDYLNQLRFSVEPRGRQGYVIHVSTEQAVREPLLDFLIQVTWPGGQLLRGYTVSLSPPVLMEAPESATQQTFGAPLSETELATVLQEETPRPQAVAEALPSAQTSTIAEVKPEVTAKSEVAAEPEVIAKPVPEVTPEAETATEPEVIAEPAVIARPAVIVKPAVIAKPTVAAKPETAGKPVVVAKREAAPKPKAVAKAKPAAKSALAGSRTEYGPVRPGETLLVIANRALPDQSLTVNQKMQAILRANPAAFIDNNINNLKTGRILRLPSKSEISAIDSQQATLDTRAQLDAWRQRQGITVAARELPAEKPAAAAPAAEKQPPTEKAAPKPPAAAELPQAATTPSGQAQLKLVPPPQEGPQTTEPGIGTGAQKEPAPDSEAVAAGKLESQDLNTRLAALEQQLTTMQKLMALKDQQLAALQAAHAAQSSPLNNPDILLAIIGVLTAGLIAMLLITMRRPQPMLLRDTPPPSAPPRAATPSAPAQHKTPAPQPAAPLGGALTEGINAEIDVYIAYARYHQAEDLIREAMVHDHSDELKLKLLEVYYAAKNAAAFEETASNLREAVAADTELWRKVVPMGRELCPNSTLFAAL